jgi:hypothetical protein
LQEDTRDPHEGLDFDLSVDGLCHVWPVVGDNQEVVVEGLDRMVRIEDDLGPRTDLTHDVQELRVRIHREVAVFQVLADKLWWLDEGIP